MNPQVPNNEAARLEALRRYRILDTAPEKSFDQITALAAYICGTPIAHISLIDSQRQWFKSKTGLDLDQTDRESAFCAHTIMGTDLFIIQNTLEDERFATNPLVTGEPRIRFYAGAPLTTPDGHNLGALCVVDRQPRELTVQQKSALAALANLTVGQLELRRASFDLAEALTNIRTLAGLLPICSYCKGIRNDDGYWQQVEDYFESHTGVSLTHGICPDCLARHFPDIRPE
jgi:GAF domain-containing protein